MHLNDVAQVSADYVEEILTPYRFWFRKSSRRRRVKNAWNLRTYEAQGTGQSQNEALWSVCR